MDLFTDFLLATGNADIGGPQGISNLLARKGYMLNLMLRGREGFKSVQGGAKIQGDVLIREVSTYRTYKPGEKQTWADPQVLENYEVDWRFSLDHKSWNDEQIELNASPEMKDEYRFQQFVDMRKKINMRCVTSLAHGMEDEFFALPSYDDMEASSGKEVNSLALFSNELQPAAGGVNGLYYSYRTAGGGTNTVQGLNKLTYSAWDNARAGYNHVGAITPATGYHLFDAFDEIILETGIKEVPGPEGAMASDPLSRPNICVTNKRGLLNFKQALRVNQDYFRMGPQDPAYPGPVFDGLMMLYLPQLDTAPIYPTAQNVAHGAETAYSTWDNAGNTTNGYNPQLGTNSAPNDGPRYHIFDFDWLHKCFHSRRYFMDLPMKSPSNQATNHVIPVNSWHNNMCRDLRRQGCIFPYASIS